MKFSKFGLLPLLALALVGCNTLPIGPATSGTTPTTTTVEPNPGTGATSQDTPATSETPTTTPGTSEDTSTTTPVATDWSEEEKALFKKYLNGNVLPYTPVVGAELMEIPDPETDIPFLAYVKFQGATQAEMDAYNVALLKTEGSEDLTEVFGGDKEFRIVGLPLANVDYNESVLVISELYQGMFLSHYIYDIDIRVWPAEEINTAVEAIYEAYDIEIPAPTFEFRDVDLYQNSKTGDFCIDLYATEADVATYVETLKTAGWTEIEEGLYHDPEKYVSLVVYWDAEYECISLLFEEYQAPVVLPEGAWTEQEIAAQKAFLNGNVLPYAPIEGAQFSIFKDPETGIQTLVYVKTANATIEDLDLFVAYLTLDENYLDFSDIFCESPNERLIIGGLANAEYHEMVFISALLTAEGQLVITFEYDIDVRVWDSEFIDANLNAIYETTGVKTVAPSFAFIDIDVMYEPEVGFYCGLYVEADPTATYDADLKAAGWTYNEKANVYLDPTEQVMCATLFDPESGYFIILYAPVPTEAPAPQA